MIEKHINLKTRGLPIRIDVVQGTNAVPIKFTLMDYDIPAGAEARIYIRKPSGLEIYNNCTIEENNVIVQPTMQMYAEKGMAKAQLQIVADDVVAASFAFCIDVAENLVSSSAVESCNEFGKLDTLINEAREMIATLGGLKPHEFTAPVQNLTTTVAGSALDAIMGKLLNDDIQNVVAAMNELSESASVYVTSGTWKPSSLSLKEGGTCCVFFTPAVATIITAGVINISLKGIISRSATNSYDFFGTCGNNSDALSGKMVMARCSSDIWGKWNTFNMNNLSDLKTTNKNSVVDAVNEVVDSVNEVYDMVGGNVRYKKATLSYVSSTQLKATIEFDAQVLGATATIRRQPSTPISSTTAIDVDIRLVGTKGYVDIYATGSYVSGHVLTVGVMAIIKV